MEKTVFWSWQSDLDARVTRDLIRSALDQAIGSLAADLDEAERPTLISDTKGVAGTPDIVATILRRIDEAAVFVGDVTPIAVSASEKACANPNVLIELGYAHRALGENRILQIWNTAFPGAELDKLPFDMRGRRGPIPFHLPVGADRDELREVRTDLAKRLAEYLRLALDQLPEPLPQAVHWRAHFPGDADLWFDRADGQPVTGGRGGTSRVRWKHRFPGFARIIPSKWTRNANARSALVSHEGHAALVVDASGLDYGVSQGGAMIFSPGTKESGEYPTWAMTQWFEQTGEFWGVGGGFLFERDGRKTLTTGRIYGNWLHFLKRNCSLAIQHGGAFPIHIRLGISDLRDSWWPRGPFDFDDDGRQAVEPSYEYDGTLKSLDTAALEAVVADAFNGLAAVYGHEPFTADEIREMAKR